MPRKDSDTLWTLKCCRAGCSKPATCVAVEPHHMALMFRDGAGLLCQQDAREFKTYGAAVMELADYAERTGSDV